MDDFGSKLEKDVLFTLDRIRSYERNKAIDDFVHECDKCCGFYSCINKQLTRDMLLEIAEQLKAGEPE